MSKKIQAGGRRVTADLAPDVIKILDKARIHTYHIHSITNTIEQIIRKADIKTLWN